MSVEGLIHTFIRLMDSKKQKPDTETERQTEKDTIWTAPTVLETHMCSLQHKQWTVLALHRALNLSNTASFIIPLTLLLAKLPIYTSNFSHSISVFILHRCPLFHTGHAISQLIERTLPKVYQKLELLAGNVTHPYIPNFFRGAKSKILSQSSTAIAFEVPSFRNGATKARYKLPMFTGYVHIPWTRSPVHTTHVHGPWTVCTGLETLL